MSLLEGIRGVLMDVDGTLLVGDAAVPGAAETLAHLRREGIALRLTTNTTRRPRAAVAEALRRAGIETSAEEVFAPAHLAKRRILASGRPRAMLLVPPGCYADFEGVADDETDPAWVVLGDLGAGFTWERLNAAFQALRRGARLLALHKNRAWIAGAEGLVLDAGPFVAALEYATGAIAEVVGKPSRAFFGLAMEEMGLRPEEVLVVGDDPETDGAGGAAAGCRIVLVRTGKLGGGEPLSAGDQHSHAILPSVANLVDARR